MDDKLLVEIGFNENDAKAYRFLLLRGSLRPTQLQKLSGESRANCYAILDRLVDAGLAIKADENKKLVYYVQSPQVLEDVVTKQITESQVQLKKVQARMPQMMSVFNDRKDAPKIKHYTGAKELAVMYEDQMKQDDKDLYFVRSIADIAFFGIVKMKEIRHLAPKYHKKRYGITPLFHAPAGPGGDRRTNLTRTWIPQDDYRNPVEWAVSGNLVQAIVMKGDGYGVSIENQEIADSFRKILQLLSKYAKRDPGYEPHPWFKDEALKTTGDDSKSPVDD